MQLKRDKQKLTMSPTELRKHKKNEAARIRTLREKKKEANRKTASALLRITPGNLNPYKTRQSFSKALNIIRTELPNTPRKKSAVAKGLASELDLAIDKQSRMPITLLLGSTPKEQCKCQVHEYLMMKLEAMGCD